MLENGVLATFQPPFDSNSTSVQLIDLEVQIPLFGINFPAIFKFQFNWLSTSGAMAEKW